LADYPQALVVVEDGGSFAANAKLKRSSKPNFGQWVLSDDSGLCVDALGGAPGVDSAIYAGPRPMMPRTIVACFEELQRLRLNDARPIMSATSCWPIRRGTGPRQCRGALPRSHSSANPHGEAGFVTILISRSSISPHVRRIGLAVKACLSHRARALATIAAAIIGLIDTGQCNSCRT